jgi:hypothetical protein
VVVAALLAAVAALLGASLALRAGAEPVAAPRAAGPVAAPAAGTVLATVDGQPITYGEYVAYGRTLLDAAGKHLTVTPEELLDQMVNRTLIVREARRRGLTPRPDVVAAGTEQGTGDARVAESVARREGLPQFVANLEVFDLYTQLREQVVGTVTLTDAERAALPLVANDTDRRIAEERAVHEKSDARWLDWLAGLRARATITRSPAPAWR